MSDKIRLRQLSSPDPQLRARVSAIITRVRREGDAALRASAREYDGGELDCLDVPRADWDGALAQLDPALRGAMERTIRNLERASEAFMPEAREVETEPGVIVGRRPDPLDKVGVYAPGGTASYPSSLLMGVVPAKAAGVRDVVVCSPRPSQMVLAAAALAGADRLFAIGGPGAIAAMAYGTETVPRVDRIIGPGNAYVSEAKLQVLGQVAIDAPAGPSELLIIADDSAHPAAIAREAVAQAEHDARAAVVVIAIEPLTIAAVEKAVADLLGEGDSGVVPRRAIVLESLQSRGAIVSVTSLDDAIRIGNDYAAEHVLLATREPMRALAELRNAGTVCVGASTSVTFGDYMTGANHVLPTGGAARSYSGLSVLDFIRWTSYQRVSPEAAASLAQDVAAFATAEGLHSHAAAARALR